MSSESQAKYSSAQFFTVVFGIFFILLIIDHLSGNTRLNKLSNSGRNAVFTITSTGRPRLSATFFVNDTEYKHIIYGLEASDTIEIGDKFLGVYFKDDPNINCIILSHPLEHSFDTSKVDELHIDRETLEHEAFW